MIVGVDAKGVLNHVIEILELTMFITGLKMPETHFRTDYKVEEDRVILILKFINHHNYNIPDYPPIPIAVSKEDFELFLKNVSSKLQKPVGPEILKDAVLVFKDYSYTLFIDV